MGAERKRVHRSRSEEIFPRRYSQRRRKDYCLSGRECQSHTWASCSQNNGWRRGIGSIRNCGENRLRMVRGSNCAVSSIVSMSLGALI